MLTKDWQIYLIKNRVVMKNRIVLKINVMLIPSFFIINQIVPTGINLW